jgi:hypothetical protein
MPAFGVAHIGEDPRLVENGPGVGSVTQGFNDDLDVVNKAGGCVSVGPSAPVFKGLREVPVEERGKRTHACAENGIGEALVEVDAYLV